MSFVVYDVRGRKVRSLARGVHRAGEHELFWDGTDDGGKHLAPGLYFSVLRTPTAEVKTKMVLLR